MTDAARLRAQERWIAVVRMLGVLLALIEVAFVPEDYPRHHLLAAWIVSIVFAAGAMFISWLARRQLSRTQLRVLGFSALCFDTAAVFAFAVIYAFDQSVPALGLMNVIAIEAAFRYGIPGAIAWSGTIAPFLFVVEKWRSTRFEPLGFDSDAVILPSAVSAIVGLFVGWLVQRLRAERSVAESRAFEAEALRDELGRRADLVDAANRCARALGSSLVHEEAFSAFIAELERLVPFDRVAILLVEGGDTRVMATAGLGADTVFPAGSTRPGEGTLLGAVMAGKTVYRPHLDDRTSPVEAALIRLGLHCRVAVPLLAGARATGVMSLARCEAASFSHDEVDLVGLLGRFVGSAVQNIRAYDELKRLSALRSDFVTMVSHEARSPMAAVLGSARTLHDRWGELSDSQRQSLLDLIAHETDRLATLISDVLDTSRIEAGTFSYTFRDLDLDELVRESAAAAAAANRDGVSFHADVREPLPRVQGDADRLRQVLANLLENAGKYSPSHEPVVVRARAGNGGVVVDVEDRGPGIPLDQQALIFEKFGRASIDGSPARPGTGLGLYIARSIAEAHGGTLDVSSTPGSGSTFRLSLPAD